MKLKIFIATVCALSVAAIASPTARAHDPNAPGHEHDPGGTGGDRHSDHTDHADHHSDHADAHSDHADGRGGHDPDAPGHTHDPTASRTEKEKSADKGIEGRGGHDPDAPGHTHDPTASRTEKEKSREADGFLGDKSSKPDTIEKLVAEFVTGKVLEAVVGKGPARVIGIGLGVLEPLMTDTTQPPAAPKDAGKSSSGGESHDADKSRHEREPFISDRQR